jgi:hypothetical protein
MLALTLEIPDWLLNGTFWCGYFSGVFSAAVIVFLALLYWARNFNPFG